MDKEDVLIDIIEKVVNDAMFAHKHTFKMYDYLVDNNLTKSEIKDFLNFLNIDESNCISSSRFREIFS